VGAAGLGGDGKYVHNFTNISINALVEIHNKIYLDVNRHYYLKRRKDLIGFLRFLMGHPYNLNRNNYIGFLRFLMGYPSSFLYRFKRLMHFLINPGEFAMVLQRRGFKSIVFGSRFWENRFKSNAELAGLYNLFKSYAGDRPVYIWGGGDGGRKTYKTLNAIGITVSAFIDGNPEKCGVEKCGLKVLPPEALLKDTGKTGAGEAHRPYVVIGSMYVKEISSKLKKLGYKETVDFLINDSL
jgi:hypothetical protein